MKKLIAGAALAALIAVPSVSRAEEITRFTPLKAEELTPPQKAWADMIAAPPRNAKFSKSALSRLYPQSRSGAEAVGAVGISALEHLAAAAPERTGDPDHRAGMDRAI